MFTPVPEAMNEPTQTVLPALDSFVARVKNDLGQLRAGQQHAALLIAFDPRDDALTPEVGASILGKVLEELPTKSAACELVQHKLAVWLPRCTRDEALTLARLMRSTVNRVAKRRQAVDQVLTSIDPAQRVPCAIGVVFANQNNWDPDALLRSAEVTAALALIANADSIKVAQQLRRPVATI